jgi:hypothetical protein
MPILKEGGLEMPGITSEQVAAFRLGTHHLSDPLTLDRLVDTVRDTCGIQAQQLNPAKLSMRARTEGLRPQDVDDALWKDWSLVRLWTLRQCVHILPTEDIPLYVAAIGSSLHRINRGWLRRHGMDAERTRSLLDVAMAALEAGPMTREELGREVARSVRPEDVKWVTSSWGGILTRGCYDGDLVFGPMRGQKTTFMRRDQVLKGWDPPEVDEARDIMVRRYLHAYGPARYQDFVNWSATTVREFKPVWERLGEDVVDIEHHGRTVQMLNEDHEVASSLEPETPTINLLGHFDTFLLGHKERTQVVDEARRKEVFRKAGWISQVVLVDGRCEGTWSVKRRKNVARITFVPFRRFSRPVKDGIAQEVEDLGRFWDVEVEADPPL